MKILWSRVTVGFDYTLCSRDAAVECPGRGKRIYVVCIKYEKNIFGDRGIYRLYCRKRTLYTQRDVFVLSFFKFFHSSKIFSFLLYFYSSIFFFVKIRLHSHEATGARHVSITSQVWYQRLLRAGGYINVNDIS